MERTDHAAGEKDINSPQNSESSSEKPGVGRNILLPSGMRSNETSSFSKYYPKAFQEPYQPPNSLVARTLEWAYAKAMNGMGIMKTVEDLAEVYLQKYDNDRLKAAKNLMFYQGFKGGMNAFLTNFGGLIALPATLPVGLLTGLYIQLRMITVMAVMGGYNVHDPRVKTLCYVCLAGKNAEKIFRSAGLKAGGKVTAAMMSGYMTSEVASVLHKALGTQALTHFSPMGFAGPAGAVSLGRFVPIAGGFASAAWTSFMTRQIGKVARDIFIEPSGSMEVTDRH